jgi:hypothetical protein
LDLARSWQADRGTESISADEHYASGLKWLGGNAESQDYERANHHFEAAAEQGHTRAQYFLGMAYYVGRGTAQSYPRARYWLEQAAIAGDRNAQYHTGDIYLNGWGVERDPDWAAMWYGRAAQQGHVGAQLSLGVCYASGLGVPQDQGRARQWWRRAALGGDATARQLLSKEEGGGQTPASLARDGWASPPVVLYVQRTLRGLGYDPGPADGIWGERSRGALSRFLSDEGVVSEPTLSIEILNQLRQAVGTLPSPFLDKLRRWFSGACLKSPASCVDPRGGLVGLEGPSDSTANGKPKTLSAHLA